jgi:hypothetical protein
LSGGINPDYTTAVKKGKLIESKRLVNESVVEKESVLSQLNRPKREQLDKGKVAAT